MKLSSSQKGFAPVFLLLGIAILVFVGVGGMYLYNQTKPGSPETQSVYPGNTQPQTSQMNSDVSDSNDGKEYGTYANEKYNFKVKYISRWNHGKYITTGNVTERGNQIIHTETTRYEGESPKTKELIFTLYEVNNAEKDNLINWWKTNVKTDIEGGTVPTDYDTSTEVTSQLWHPSKPLEPWESAPPGLLVTLKPEFAEKVGVFNETSVYLYYDFGRPFVVNFPIFTSGAGATADIFADVERSN